MSIFSYILLIILIVLGYYAYKNRDMISDIYKNYSYGFNPNNLKDSVEDVIDDGAEYVALGADTIVGTLKKNKKPKKPKPLPIEKPKTCVNKDNKEVFNIAKNVFTYNEAKYVCKAFNAELATYDQVKRAQKNGANWCNYGWSSNQMALYPIQKDFHDNLDEEDKEKGICGKPGINGGYFKDSKLKFGVNCYGYKPKPNKNSLIYLEDGENAPSRRDSLERKRIADMKGKLGKLGIDTSASAVNAFSSDRWSSGSCKRSYVLKDEYLDNKLHNVTKKSIDNIDVNDILEGEPMTEEFYSKIHIN